MVRVYARPSPGMMTRSATICMYTPKARPQQPSMTQMSLETYSTGLSAPNTHIPKSTKYPKMNETMTCISRLNLLAFLPSRTAWMATSSRL